MHESSTDGRLSFLWSCSRLRYLSTPASFRTPHKTRPMSGRAANRSSRGWDPLSDTQALWFERTLFGAVRGVSDRKGKAESVRQCPSRQCVCRLRHRVRPRAIPSRLLSASTCTAQMIPHPHHYHHNHCHHCNAPGVVEEPCGSPRPPPFMLLPHQY